jgi:hypothetical protein
MRSAVGGRQSRLLVSLKVLRGLKPKTGFQREKTRDRRSTKLREEAMANSSPRPHPLVPGPWSLVSGASFFLLKVGTWEVQFATCLEVTREFHEEFHARVRSRYRGNCITRLNFLPLDVECSTGHLHKPSYKCCCCIVYSLSTCISVLHHF